MMKIDAVNFKSNHKTFKPPLHRSGDGTINKTGFMNQLKLKVGAKVMLTNGQTGILEHDVKDCKGGVKYLMVKFNRESAGKMTRKENTTGETVSYTLCIKLHTVCTITHCVLKFKNYTFVITHNM